MKGASSGDAWQNRIPIGYRKKHSTTSSSLPDPFSREPKYDPEDAEVLRSAINSVNMKSAWLSIERRRSKASPKEFAIAIVHVSCMSVFKQMEQT